MKILHKEQYIDSKGKMWLIFKTDVGDLMGHIAYTTFYVESANVCTPKKFFPDAKKFQPIQFAGYKFKICLYPQSTKVYADIVLSYEKKMSMKKEEARKLGMSIQDFNIKHNYMLPVEAQIAFEVGNLAPEILDFFKQNLLDILESERALEVDKIQNDANMATIHAEESHLARIENFKKLGFL
ncbi:MAG: hypothetical protein UT24_C0011G0024 [Candidatus Woesebacteria bacterium GW2011_GWB1_39_12]|uniref:Uncharacterized protein n=1 Tax=Candidatus Woesebacteria bacterium GW2011_GWB1_39_12 TaxID=1618574 RepID=A0A0G0MJK3_9BACT|nr:MAG: hypothetical protein UT24_C0011G0024 [Candidatus Woesebacteria bacterium GW2011_GWB1_39_12]